MDFTQTELMKSKKERSRDQAKDRKALKQKLQTDSGAVGSTPDDTEGYGEFGYGKSITMKHSWAHAATADYDEDDNHSIDSHPDDSESYQGADGHIYVDDTFKNIGDNVPKFLGVVDAEKYHMSSLRQGNLIHFRCRLVRLRVPVRW